MCSRDAWLACSVRPQPILTRATAGRAAPPREQLVDLSRREHEGHGAANAVGEDAGLGSKFVTRATKRFTIVSLRRSIASLAASAAFWYARMLAPMGVAEGTNDLADPLSGIISLCCSIILIRVVRKTLYWRGE